MPTGSNRVDQEKPMFKRFSLDLRKQPNLEDTPMLRKTKSATGAPQTSPEVGDIKFMKCVGTAAMTFLALLATTPYLKAQAAQAPQQYTVVDLGTLGGTFSLAG